MAANFGQLASTNTSVAVYELPAYDEDQSPEPGNDEYDAQRDRFILQKNATWFCRLRWSVVAFLAMAGILAFFPSWTTRLGFALSPTWLLGTATILMFANIAHVLLLRDLPANAAAGRVRVLLWSQIVFDLVLLTVVIHYLGGSVRYAPVTYLFHIILACIFFRRGESLGVIVVSAVLLSGLVCLEFFGAIERSSVVTQEAYSTTVPPSWSVQGWQLSSLLVIWVIIWHLVSRLSAQLRDREHELIATNLRLEVSSAERARHMLQTTHELKAPFAAIHASTQLLLGNYAGSISQRARNVVEKIAARANVLSKQIQEMLQLANLRSQSQASPIARLIDVRSVIEDAVERIEAQVRVRRLSIETDLESVHVQGADDYLTMLIDNLLQNAVSYSFDQGKIGIVCRQTSDTIASIVVRDYGIGIPAEKLPLVFQDYYRTIEATRHNRASTGLGLAIVKLVARALQISLQIESLPGWGTRVTLQMPAVSNHPSTPLADEGE